MTAIPHPPAARPVSERLLLPLRQIAGRTRVLHATRGILLAAFVALSAWLLIAMVLGSFSGMPIWARLACSLVAWLALAWSLIRFLIPSMSRPGLTHAARMVDSALPDANERISSAIELSEEPDSPHKGSPELVAALVRQAERDAENVDPVAVISSRSVIYAAVAAFPLAVLWLVALATYPGTMSNGLARIVQPWTSNPPVPTAVLTVEPGDKELPQGATLDITLNVAPPPRSRDARDFSVARATITSSYDSGQQVTSELERTGPTSFRARIENLQQGLHYTITADGAQSRAYKVTVAPLPALVSADVTYTYPSYIGDPPQTDLGKDGSLSAPAGTRADITFHLTQDVTPTSSLILKTRDAKGGARELRYLLTQKAERLYTVRLDLIESGHYELQLTTDKGLVNAETISRTVTVSPDTPPEVAILSPSSTSKARPTDTVEIKYSAKDDHGITGLEMIIQAEGGKEDIQLVQRPRVPARTIEAAYPLSIPDILRRAGVPNARQVTYQLRAKDAAEPINQTALSQKHTLLLDERVGSPQQQRDHADQSELASAIKKQSDALDKSQQVVDEQKKSGKPLTPEQKKELDATRRELEDASRNLARTADDKRQSSFGDIARDAKNNAEKSLENAAGKMAEASQAADNPKPRNDSLDRAGKEIADARKRTDELQSRLEEAGRQRETANGLSDLADQHRRIAEKERTDPAGTARDKEKLQKDLDKLLSQNDKARADLEKAAQEKNQSLARKAEKVADQETPLVDRTQAAADAANAGNTLSQIAKDQEKLRKDAEAFADKHRDALKQSGATAPDKKRLEQIEKDLTPQKAGDAQRNQENIAEQLDRTAEKLDLSAKNADRAAGGAQKAAEKAAENAEKAGDLKQRSEQLAKDIEKAKADNKPPTRSSDPANQKAWELARDLKNAASGFANQNPAQRQAAVDAAREADSAADSARAGRAEDAQKKLADAAAKLKAAADQVNQQAQKAASTGPAKAAQDAQRDARDLADRQRDLAERTEQVTKAGEKAAADQKTADAARQQQRQNAEQMDKLAQEASTLANENKDAAPQSAKAAQRAAESFKNAAEKQRAAAKASASGNDEHAARDQQAAHEDLNRGISSLGGQPRQTASTGKPPRESTARSGTPSQRTTPAERNTGNASAGADTQTASTPPKAADTQAASTQNATPPNGANRNAPENNAHANGAKPGENPKTGDPSGNKTGEPNAGNTPTAGGSIAKPAPEPGRGSPSGQAGAQSNTADPGGANNSAAHSGGKPSPEDIAMEKAAQAGAQASEELRRANASNDPADRARAQQAIENARDAFSALEAARQAKAGKNNGSATAKSNDDPGTGQAPGAGTATKPAGNTPGGSGEGLAKLPVDNKVPDAVRELGISPGDWARLPPDVQGQLLNAAQQKGPPAYREAIKKYFTRVAQMQATD